VHPRRTFVIALIPPGAGGILALAIGFAMWMFFEFAVRKRRSLRTWIVDGIVATLVVVGTALLPLRAHARIASLALGFIVFVPVLLAAGFLWSMWLIRKYRKGLIRGEDTRQAEQVPIPPLLEPGRDAFAGLGFEDVATVRLGNGSLFVHLIRPEDGIVAEVVSHPPPSDPTPILEISSILAGRSGVLATSTSGLGARLWAGELRQVFPGAPVAHLLESHLAGLEFLRSRGIEPDLLRAHEVLEAKEEMLARGRSAAANAPSKLLRSELVRGSRGRHTAVGLLAAQEDVGARIDAIYELRALSVPGGGLPAPPPPPTPPTDG
jgi:hypothetical protein